MEDRAMIRARSFEHWKYCMKESLRTFPKWVSIVIVIVNFCVVLLAWISMVLFMNGYGYALMASFGEDYPRMFSLACSIICAWILVCYSLSVFVKAVFFGVMVRSGRFDDIGPVYKVDEL